MNKYILVASIIGVSLIFVMSMILNYFATQNSFSVKQKCHDEAINYVNNKRLTYEKQIKIDNSIDSFNFIYDTYNQNLNTCIVLYGDYLTPDHKKYPDVGDSFTLYADDVLTGKQLAMWQSGYNLNSTIYESDLSYGMINGNITHNPSDFTKKLNELMVDSTIIDDFNQQLTPIPTISIEALPNVSPSPTIEPKIINQTNSTSTNTFTCVDPTAQGWDPAPCIILNPSNGICEDTKNGAVFSCTNATRLSNSYPPPTPTQ